MRISSWRVHNDFGYLILTYSRESGKHGGGESGVMCCDFREVRNVEPIFSNVSLKNSTNLSAKGRGGFINGRILAGSLCNTSPRIGHFLFFLGGGC